MSLLTDVDAEVLYAHMQLLYLELRAVELVMSHYSTVPAFNGSDWWLGWRLVLHECDPIAVWFPDTLLSWWQLVVVEEMLCFHHGLWELVLLHGHAVCQQVNLELVEPGVVQSLQDHAR